LRRARARSEERSSRVSSGISSTIPTALAGALGVASAGETTLVASAARLAPTPVRRATLVRGRAAAPNHGRANAKARVREATHLERLWKRLQARGGSAARNALVEAYQHLAESAVRRLLVRLPRSVDPGDLLAAANVGLIAAIEGFDPTRGVNFETYCEWRLRGALMDELRLQDWLPRAFRARLAQLRRASDTLRAELGREPTDDELGEHLGWSVDELANLPQAPRSVHLPGAFPSRSSERHGASHSGRVGGSNFGNGSGRDDAPSLEEVVADGQSEQLGERLTREELLRLMSQHMTAQECRVVYLKYWEELPLREIGELEGLSESRVCKIHLRLIERLRQTFEAEYSG
jgi:RNA polymerase sigma factor for flagellar operon FliA